MANKPEAYDIQDPCGYGVIIINSFKNFPLYIREGAEDERKYFETLFQSFGLTPIFFEDLSKEEIFDKLYGISKEEALKNHSMIAIAISSYGAKKGLFGVDIETRLGRMEKQEPLEDLKDFIELEDVKNLFSAVNCQNLAAKPKLILFNGWKEDDEEIKVDGKSVTAAPFTDLVVISSSFGICAPFVKLPASQFPKVLCDTLCNYYTTPILELGGVLKDTLIKLPMHTIIVGDDQLVEIRESCSLKSTLRFRLQLCYRGDFN